MSPLTILTLFLSATILIYRCIYKRRVLLDLDILFLVYHVAFYQVPIITFPIFEVVQFDSYLRLELANFIFVVSYMVCFSIPAENHHKKLASVNFYTTVSSRSLLFLILVMTFFISIILWTVYYVKTGSFPMFLEEVEQGRIASQQLASGFVTGLMQFSNVFLALGLAYASIKRSKSIALVVVCISILLWAPMASKRALAGILLTCLLYYHFAIRKVGNTSSIVAMLSLFCLIVVYGSFRLFGDISSYNAAQIFKALMHAETFNLSHIFESPPPIMLGGSYLNMISMIFSDTRDIGTELKNYYGMNFRGGGITVGITGEGYLNFRWIGVAVESLIFWTLVRLLVVRLDFYTWSQCYIGVAKSVFYSSFLLWMLRNGLFTSVIPWLFVVVFESIFYITGRAVLWRGRGLLDGPRPQHPLNAASASVK